MNYPLVELQDVCRFISGGTPSTKVPEYFTGTIPWITGADMNGNVITKARQYITEEAIQNSATNIVPKGNILLVTRTGVGKVAIAGIDICISQDFTGLELDRSKVDEWYLFYYLCSQEEALTSQQRGATIQGITRDVVETLQIPLPPLTEQKRIVSLLARADRLRQLRRTAHDLGDALLQSVFLEMFGDVVRNEKGWEKATISDFGKVQTGNTPSREEPENFGNYIEWIKSDNIRDDQFYISPSREMLSEIGLKKGRSVVAGSIFVTCIAGSLDHVGDTAITNRTVAFNQQINAITPFDDVNSLFLRSMLHVAKPYIQFNASAGMKHIITKSKLEELVLVKPPLSLQEEFASVVARVESLRGRMSEATRQAEGLFESLLHQSFGE